MTRSPGIAVILAGALALAGLARIEPANAAAPPADTSSADTSSASGPGLPSVEDDPGQAPLPDVTDSPAQDAPAPSSLDPGLDPGPDPGPVAQPPPPKMVEPIVVRVAVGLSSELDGSKDELALLDRLEQSMRRSPQPSADVRRLRVGSAEASEICREGRDDLVIHVGYLPERDEPVLMTRDCRIDESLGVRAAPAADDPALLEVLWAEHDDRVASGARERRRVRISPKVRTGLIAGAAILVIGAAVALLIAGAVRKQSVVLVVTPAP